MTEEPKEAGRRHEVWNITVRQASLFTGAVAVSFLLGVSAAISTANFSNAAEVPGPGFGAVQAGSFADLVESVSPAVVSIEVEGEEAIATVPFSQQFPDPFEEFFRRFGQESPWDNAPRSRPVRSAGAGFIISSDGYVVTNNHVVDSANEITVTLHDGREFEASLIGTDSDTDVALLKLDGVDDLPTVEFGDDSELRVGDWVVAVGNPFGLGGTVTAGIVSAIGRDIGFGPYTDYIQIDAPINRGNSGGPAFDVNGRVVGMNTAIFSPSGGNVGIGFAIPASNVQAVVAQLQEHGSVSRGWLGVQIQDLTPDLAESVGLEDAQGAIVASVVSGSPADRAGFQTGDVILEIDGDELEGSVDLTRRVGNLRPGESARFTVFRDGRRQTISATLERRNSDRLAGLGAQSGEDGTSLGALGLQVAPLTPALRQQYDIAPNVTGVLVVSVDPGSDAATKGMSAGDVITRVGNLEVELPSDVEDALDNARAMGRDAVLLLVTDDTGQHFVALDISQD